MTENMDHLTFTLDYQDAYRDADVIFIGVGTPEKVDGSANLSYVYEVAKKIAESVEKDCVVVVKSTVPIGTNDKVRKMLSDVLSQGDFSEPFHNPEIEDTIFYQCNLRRPAVDDAFSSGRPAAQNSRIPHLNLSVNGKG